MIHVVRRFLPLILGPLGGLLGSVLGWLVLQVLGRTLSYFWLPYPGWGWLTGLLVYPGIGLLLAIPFVYVYGGKRQPLGTELARTEDTHLRTWIAVFIGAYLPVGLGFLYYRWWGAPSMAIPFTDTWLYAGSQNGALMAAMIAVAIFAPFCSVGVERLSRGMPRPMRILFGPPTATLLTMLAVVAALIVAGGLWYSWPTPEPYGPALQPLSQLGWDTATVSTMVTVVTGCFAGAFSTLVIVLPALTGLPDIHPAATRRRWALPMFATAFSGVLAVVALVQGFGLDSFNFVNPKIVNGQRGVVGTLVAPTDSDVLGLEVDEVGLYLLELPSPPAGGRHQVTVPGIPLPTRRADQVRFLVDLPATENAAYVTMGSTWPPSVGVAEYSGPVRFEKVDEVMLGKPLTPQELVLEAGQIRRWKVASSSRPIELVVDPSQAASWTFLAPEVAYSGGWAWTPGWSVVVLDVLVDGVEVHSQILGEDGYSLSAASLLIADADRSSTPPKMVLRLTPATRPGESVTLSIVGEGLPAGVPLVHPVTGTTLITVEPGEEPELWPEPGGTFAGTRLVPVDAKGADWVVERYSDGGELEPTGAGILMLGKTRLRITGGEPGAHAVLVAGRDLATHPGGATLPP